ncbi:two-component system, NtrC family, response regulator PilR [Mariprofundus ferrinatatus]|uniref:Two-component system, NtrC family, response regulator PilR n=1 Tax=Mariprofundus ferrinatatus TaxID=1921087 RepID=A0A2K8L8R9_9PROT|nr:sigma-54 dependent transcriptional regulator [Mariprofundus ferrinatatus]ATX82639.1 two-component system, NtrC family, response regulator PilR [Mariprofundus ferrinatatus]
MADILLVEDEANARQILSLGLNMQGHQVSGCASAEEAEQLMQAQNFDVVLTDLRMDGRDAGIDVIRAGKRLLPDARILLLTAYASADTAVAAMKEGAFDYLTKPVSADELAVAVEIALADIASADSAHEAEAEDELAVKNEMLIGESEPMKRVRSRLMRAAQSDFTVLIGGESGTGKELAARTVHTSSSRAGGPFVPVHCGAIPEGLFESELFGHRKGAFTGADLDRPGLIESANGGTLFLDEVGEMPLSVQVKLLRVLQERRVRRVGDDREHDVDVRIIAATNRDLEAEVRKGTFREDLFFRLNVVPVHMPPLRQRREDIPVLARAIVRQWSGGRSTLSEGCLKRLSEFPFTGNVRELENLLQRMLALSESGDLDVALLNELYLAPQPVSEISLYHLQQQQQNLDEWMELVERQLIDEALARTGGNITRAAEELGISFRSLRYRLKKLGLSGGDE